MADQMRLPKQNPLEKYFCDNAGVTFEIWFIVIYDKEILRQKAYYLMITMPKAFY